MPSTLTSNTYGTLFMLQVDRLTKRYGERVAVDAISFNIAQGETVGLLGPNGAGKTTATSMICGISRPDSGEVTLGGVKLTQDAKRTEASLSALCRRTWRCTRSSRPGPTCNSSVGSTALGAPAEPRAQAVLALVGLTDRSAWIGSRPSAGA